MLKGKTKLIKLLTVLLLTICIVMPQAAFSSSDASVQDSDLEYLKSVIDMIKDKYRGNIDSKKLIEGALKGMFDTMDAYTVYFTPNEANSFLMEMEGVYEGIGISMTVMDDYLVIDKVFDNSPAKKAGLKEGDIIVEAQGRDLIGASPEEAASIIRGEVGTKVTLGIIKKGETNITTIEVTRERIKINPVTYSIRGGIGYIKLDIFNMNTDEYMTRALEEMDSKKIDRIILDLRGNPGGEVSQAVAVARKFVPKGLITKLDFKSESISDILYYSDLEKPKYKLAVLVDGMTASASEILAGAIQDTKAGVLVGTNTFGKAKVQNIIPILSPEAYRKYEEKLGVKLVDGFELYQKYGIYPQDDEIMGLSKITTGEYVTPAGRMIDGIGLAPDIYADGLDEEKLNELNGIKELTLSSQFVLGSKGPDILNAEKILKASGYDIKNPDETFGEDTYIAIAKFQDRSGLLVTGVLDITTQKALNDKLKSLVMSADPPYARALEILTK